MNPIESKPFRVLSLGAGVQSTVVYLLAVNGEIDRFDCAIFADTEWEPQAVYDHLDRLEAFSPTIPIYRVSAGALRSDALQSMVRDTKRWAPMPLYTVKDGKKGMIRRQCTKEYKVEPIEKKIRDLLGVKRLTQNTPVEMTFGISADEITRMRTPQRQWQRFRYPLIFERPMSRVDCNAYLLKNWGQDVPRSACIGCPFHSDFEWRSIKADPEQWQDVVSFDEAIRDRGGDYGQLFLHRKARPLTEVVFTDEDTGESTLFDDECYGLCGT